ncbi:putative mitochondrial protein, partial [Mucuna pruriens]
MKTYHPEQQFIGNVQDKLVSLLEEKSIIGTKWVFRNKLDENGNIVRNKVRDYSITQKLWLSLLLCKLYMDDIIFGASNDSLCREFFELMQKEFKMSMVRELNFFFILQIKQIDDDIVIHQTKYAKELLKKFKLDDCKSMSTLMHPTFVLSLNESNKKVDQTTYGGMNESLLYPTTSR